MFRVKVVASLLLVFVAVAVVVHINVSESITDETRAAVEARLRTAKAAVETRRRLNAYAIVAKAEQVAAWPPLAKILTTPIETFADEEGALPSADDYAYKLHQLMNVEVDVWNLKFQALANGKSAASAGLVDFRRTKPNLFVVTDAKGVGVANAADVGKYGPEQDNLGATYPSVLHAINGNGKTRPGPVQDLWSVKGAPMMVGVVPIRSGGRPVGAVVIGYRLTDGEAKSDKASVGTEVAFHLDGRMARSSSLSPAVERQLQKLLKDKAVGEGQSLHSFTLEGKEHLGLSGQLTGNATAKSAGFVVLSDLQSAQKKAGSVLMIIPMALGLGLVLCLGLILVFFQRFMAPLEEIDRGVMEIINGDLDYWFEVAGTELPGTMSQNLNIMVCSLSGRPLPDEEGSAAGQWQEGGMRAGESHTPVERRALEAGQTGGLAEDVVAAVTSGRDAYEMELYRVYVQALRRSGHGLAGLTLGKFSERLAALTNQCAQGGDVRFVVRSDDSQVLLQPIPIS